MIELNHDKNYIKVIGKEAIDMLKYIEEYTVGQETAFYGVIDKGENKSFKAGINSYGCTRHCPQCSGYSTIEDAKEAYEWYKSLVDNQ